MSAAGRLVPPLGTHGNIWNDASTGVATNGDVVNTFNSPFVSAFGHVDAASTLTLMLSADGSHFYAGPTVTTSGAGDFYINATVGCQYVTLQSSASVTATASIQAKG